ncbi:hypothetical protein SAMN04489761_3347 [Tenacibaculum sp. MAR_2009_124]|nr:hypothetical protein SAMN04489761_3347 [Tenacibaculum sp. MAR_2009_124]
MNKSLTNKVLIFFVVLIWALVVYKYWFRSSSENQFQANEVNYNKVVHSPKKIKEVSVVTLNRDPFLNEKLNVKKRKEKRVKSNVTKKKNFNRKSNNNIWPKIKYLGFLQKENKSKNILLIINGRFKKISKNEIILQDFRIKQVFKDSIIIEGKKKIKTIKKGS